MRSHLVEPYYWFSVIPSFVQVNANLHAKKALNSLFCHVSARTWSLDLVQTKYLALDRLHEKVLYHGTFSLQVQVLLLSNFLHSCKTLINDLKILQIRMGSKSRRDLFLDFQGS